MKKYNVGVIGHGWVATAHIPAINATTLGQVRAVYSSRKLDSGEHRIDRVHHSVRRDMNEISSCKLCIRFVSPIVLESNKAFSNKSKAFS